MSNEITTCLDAFRKRYHKKWLCPINPNAKSESASNDDYESIGFKGYANKNQTREEKTTWATDSKRLAENSLKSRLIQLPLELISHFISNSELIGSWWEKGFFTAKSLAETFANKFQNDIYALKGDNVDAENYAADKEKGFGDTKTAWISNLNNQVQTKFRFLTPILGLVSPDLASDIDSGLFEMIESTWWRKMSLNSGFYPGIVQDLLKKVASNFSKNKETKTESHPPTWDFIKKQFKKHLNTAKYAKKEFEQQSDENKKITARLRWCKSWDQLTSIIMPFICLPSNLVGDTVRPILRRLNLSGSIRTLTRTLSVADRALVGINYWFRFYLPEKISEDQQSKKTPKNNNNIFSRFKYSHLYLASLVGDALDLPLTIFEDKINESGKPVQHSVEILRILKNFAFDSFWSGRRARIANETLNSIQEETLTKTPKET